MTQRRRTGAVALARSGIAAIGATVALAAGALLAVATPHANAAPPAMDVTPSVPVAMTNGKPVAPGGTVEVSLSQEVGKTSAYGRYTELSLYDTVGDGYLTVPEGMSAKLFKVKGDDRTEVNGAGTLTYDAGTDTLRFDFSKDYLSSKMEMDGETYELDYSLRLTDDLGKLRRLGSDRFVSLDHVMFASASTKGSSEYVKQSNTLRIEADTEASPVKSSDGKTVSQGEANPFQQLVSFVQSLLGNDANVTNGNEDGVKVLSLNGNENDSADGTVTTEGAMNGNKPEADSTKAKPAADTNANTNGNESKDAGNANANGNDNASGSTNSNSNSNANANNTDTNDNSGPNGNSDSNAGNANTNTNTNTNTNGNSSSNENTTKPTPVQPRLSADMTLTSDPDPLGTDGTLHIKTVITSDSDDRTAEDVALKLSTTMASSAYEVKSVKATHKSDGSSKDLAASLDISTGMTLEDSKDSVTVEVDITFKDDTQSGSYTIYGDASATDSKGGSTGSKQFKIARPTVTPSLAFDNTKPSASDIVTGTLTVKVSGGTTALGVTAKVTLDGIDGMAVSASDGGTVNGNTITWNLDKVSGNKAVTFTITLPKDGSANGKSITAKASTEGTNFDASTNSTTATATVAAPSVSVKMSVKAVSDKPLTDGTTGDSEGKTDSGTGSDSSDTAKTAATTDGTDNSGEGGTDTTPETKPETKPEGNLVINVGDKLDYTVEVSNGVDANANDIVLTDSLDEDSAKKGVYIDKSTMKLALGGKDVTADAKLEWQGDSADKPTGYTVSGLSIKGIGKLVVTYRVVAGEPTNDQIRGTDITSTASASGANFAKTADQSVTVTIASATLTPTLNVSNSQLPIGQVTTYDLVIRNTDKNSSSVARNVYVSSIIDDNAAKLNYQLDPSTLKVLSVEDGKATDVTKDVTVKWDGTKSFTVDTKVNLAVSTASSGQVSGNGSTTGNTNTNASNDNENAADDATNGNATASNTNAGAGTATDDASKYANLDHALVVSYQGSAKDVADTAKDTTMTNSVLTKADNATYAAANKSILLVGAEDTPDNRDGGSYNDDLANTGSLSQTGDMLMPAVAGIAGVAAIVAAAIAIYRKRH